MNISQNKIKSITAFTLALLLALTSFPFSVSAEELTTGSCGENTTYSFDSATGTLTISGTGATRDLTYADASTNNGDFCGNESIKSVIIENGITKIGDFTFYKCTGLTTIEIPDSVTAIGTASFSDCDALTAADIPNSVTVIGGSAFSSCDKLETVHLPESITEIKTFTFSECSNLRDISIPETVTKIGESAFGNCYNLTAVTIPDSVTEMERMAFASCQRLASVTLSQNITRLEENVLTNCAFESITIPDSVTFIGESAFSNCTHLKSIDIPDGVTQIEAYAFNYCTALTTVRIPASVTSIKKGAFDVGTGDTEPDRAVYILSKDCEIEDDETTFNDTDVIYGLTDSTAQAYAEKYSRTFNTVCTDGTDHHDFTDTTTATCTEDGTKTYTCSNCGYSYTEDDAAFGHQWGEWSFDAETKTHIKVCENDNTHTQSEACSFDEGVITKEASCTEEGETTFTCSVCGGTYTESIE